MYSSTSSDDEDEEQEDEDEPEVLVVEQYVQRVLVSPPIHSWDYVWPLWEVEHFRKYFVFRSTDTKMGKVQARCCYFLDKTYEN